MSIIWKPPSCMAETIAYVFAFCTNVATSLPPPSMENSVRLRPSASAIDAVRVGLAGSVTSMICTPSSSLPSPSGGSSDETTAYVLLPTDTALTADAPERRSNVPPSTAADATVGEKGFVTLIIVTPFDFGAATTAYVLPPTENVSTERAPSSASNRLPSASTPWSSSGASPTPTASSLPSIIFAIGYE